jgi:putative ABC transport system permease protein
MLSNYLAAALRNLVRNKLYAAINIVGLAAGFAAALLIALFVRDEFSYDRFFPDYQQIYLLGSEASLPGRAKEYPDLTTAELAPLLKADFAAIGTIARMGAAGVSVQRGDLENNETIQWADPNIFDIFPFKVLAGSLKDSLKEPNDIVLTRKIARKYFGKDDPVGDTLDLGTRSREIINGVRQQTFKRDAFKVTAVIEDLPSNTHLAADIIAPAQSANSFIAQSDANPPGPDTYGLTVQTYLKLQNPSAAQQVRDGLSDFMKRHKPRFARDDGNGLHIDLILRPITSLHLAPGMMGVQKPRGNIHAIYEMAAIGMLIVLAACINFVNLMTARATRRATEVGVRKVSGAARRHLIAQFIGEALIYGVMGLTAAAGVAWFLLPEFNALLDRTIALGFFDDLRLPAFLVALILLMGICAGAYPAFVLASFRPATVLKGAIIRRSASTFVRQMLVVAQFAILIGLLAATAVIYRQTQFALTEAKRLNSDQVVIVDNATCGSAFEDRLRALPGVHGAVCSSGAAFGLGDSLGLVRAADGSFIRMEMHAVRTGFFEFYGVKPVAGRAFSEDHVSDTGPAGQNVVLNEAAARRLGYGTTTDAIGKSTSLDARANTPAEIIGVVPDFALDAVHQAVPPIAYTTNVHLGFLSVRIDGARAPETLQAIDKLWKDVVSPQPITRSFLDQHIAELYADITRQATLIAIFAGVAVSISMLGLFGMSASVAERRIKEIGVRKAMGARNNDILRLLLWEFAKPVLWANVIAWPVGYFLMRRWLEGFAYHVNLSPWLFLAASALALAIAVLTVIGHALLVARAQPVAALRYE